MAALAVLAGVSGAGCGKATQARPDGGDGSVSLGDALGPGRHFFDVIAGLSPVDGGSVPPQSNSFTLVIDVDAGVAIAGGSGRAAAVGLTSADGRTFRTTGSFSVGAAGAGQCSGAQDVRYDSLEVTVAGNGLTGSATGVADISCGDCSFTAPFTARLAGTPDSTSPTLHLLGVVPASPFDSFSLIASEPLPATATARLVASDGAAIDLVPVIATGAIPLISAFSKPDVVLRAGQTYFVTFDGLVDLAGHVDPSGTPLGLASFPAAPTVPEDGFESATGATLGGAMVMTAGVLPAISGNTSLYLGAPGTPGLDLATGRSLMVHLARQAGDTMLRFSYRVISVQSTPAFSGMLRVGSEGASPGQATTSFPLTTTGIGKLTIAGQIAYASDVATMTAALPADATDQVLVYLGPFGGLNCGPGFAAQAGLLIDDLRLE